ncbi:MAG: hypothetical protein K2K12_01170, partial [Clostridia bacterium]|nr:hypothetical protein [Clostridia bacterium]
KSDAGDYTTKVALKIKSDYADKYRFDDGTTDGSKTAEAEVKWSIAQAELDLDKLVWQWRYVGDTSWNDFKKDGADNMPAFKSGFSVETRVDTSKLPEGLSAADFEIEQESPMPKTLGDHGTTLAFNTTLSNANYARPANDVVFAWKITKKQIKITNWVTGVLPDTNGDDQGVKVIDCHDEFKDAIEYLYTFDYVDEHGTTQHVVDMAGADALTLLYTYADTDTVIPVTVRVKITDTANYEFADGIEGVKDYTTFNAGDGLEKVTVVVTGSGSTYGDVNLGVTATLKDGSSVNSAFYTVKLCDKDGEVLKELAADDLNDPANYRDVLKDAGDYIIKVALTELGELNGYYLSGATSEYKILPKEISAPVIAGTVSFTGSDIDVSGYFDGDFAKYVSDGIVEIAGGTVNRNAGDYKAYLKIVNSNYAWKEEEGVVVNDAELVLPWTINRAVLTTDSWNLKGKNGAVLNALANWQSKINAGEVNVGLDYRYYDNDRLQLQDVEFKGGSTYFVDAVLTGEDANNFEFADGLGEDKSITPMVEYKVPKSGAAVFFGSIGEFFENYWQPFVSGVCIVLSAIFAGLIGHFDSQRRKANKEAKQYKTGTQEPKQYKTAAVAATGLFGLAYATWTIIACVLIGLAVALFIGIFIAKARRNKAREALEAAKIEYAENKVVLAEQAKQDEADRLKKEQADEREEEKRRRDEEREEERRRREEERDEEKRRKEEEREEEKRRREEQREEERRRREEEREDERRRREDERRIAAMSNNNMGMGMGYGAMSPFAMQYAQPPVVQQQPMVMQPAQQPVQMVQPAQQVVASTDESKLEKAVEKLATELGHQKRVEGFLDMISKSREKDQAALAQSEKALEERKKKFEARRENMSAPFEPSVQRVYIPAMPANANTREKELELE